jgi:hypothetical protein
MRHTYADALMFDATVVVKVGDVTVSERKAVLARLVGTCDRQQRSRDAVRGRREHCGAVYVRVCGSADVLAVSLRL